MSLHHLPTMQMVSGSTHDMKRTTPPPARRKCALMSSKVKPIDGPAYFTMALMAAVMLSPWICLHLLPFLKIEICVLPVARWHHRYATRRRMAATGHSWGWLVWPCPINAPLTPLLRVVNKNGGGCAETTFVGPSLCRRVIGVRVDVCQGRQSRGEDQELHE